MSKKSAARRHKAGVWPSATSVNQMLISAKGPPSTTPESTKIRTQPAFGRHLWANGPMCGLYLSPPGDHHISCCRKGHVGGSLGPRPPGRARGPCCPKDPQNTLASKVPVAWGRVDSGPAGVSPRRREEGEARGHSSAPRPLNRHPSTHPTPAWAPSGRVSQRHQAALDTGAVHTEKRLDGGLGKQPWSPICLPSQFRPSGRRAVASPTGGSHSRSALSALHCCDWKGSVRSGA